ncbi:MAG: MOFRL family protein, partial [Thiotrichaceae bacterium]
TDGVTDDAGAMIDNHTLQRGYLANLDPVTCLNTADSGTFLEASGDLIHVGATGTNVMDVIIGLKL